MEPSRCGGSDFREQAIVSEGFDWVYKWERNYLVELHGELMLLIRLKDRDWTLHPVCKIISFNLYKLKPGYKGWMRVTSLGDYALFVGINSSFSISDNDDPSGRCKPNCIYFSDHDNPANFDSNIGGHDLGVFNLKGDGSVEQWPYYTDKPESLWYCRLPYGSRPPCIKLHPATKMVMTEDMSVLYKRREEARGSSNPSEHLCYYYCKKLDYFFHLGQPLCCRVVCFGCKISAESDDEQVERKKMRRKRKKKIKKTRVRYV